MRWFRTSICDHKQHWRQGIRRLDADLHGRVTKLCCQRSHWQGVLFCSLWTGQTVGWKSCYSHGTAGVAPSPMSCKTSNRNDRSTESNVLAMSTSSRIANRGIILQPSGNIVPTKKHPPSEHRLEGRKPCDPTTQVRWEQLWRHSWSPANLRKQDNGESRGVKKSIKTWRRPDDKHLATVQSEVLCNSGSNGKTLLCVMPG